MSPLYGVLAGLILLAVVVSVGVWFERRCDR